LLNQLFNPDLTGSDALSSCNQCSAGILIRWAIVQTILHVGLRFGQAETVDDTLLELLGHPSRSLRDYIQDHRRSWLKTH